MNSGQHSFNGPKNITRPGLTGKVVHFAEFLKARGFKIFQSSLHDALRGLGEIRIIAREDFLAVLRANLTTSDLEWRQFAGLFEEFWGQEPEEPEDPENETRPFDREVKKDISDSLPFSDVKAIQSVEIREDGHTDMFNGIAYSPVSRVEKMDLASLDSEVLIADTQYEPVRPKGTYPVSLSASLQYAYDVAGVHRPGVHLLFDTMARVGVETRWEYLLEWMHLKL